MSNYWVRSSTCPFIRHKNDLLDPMLNVSCGSSILASLLDIYPSTKDALIAYNGGQGCFKSKKCLAQASAYANKVLNKL
jgi:soluble lytic murein transglycosylase-like protein